MIANYFLIWKQDLPDVRTTTFPPLVGLSFVAFAGGVFSKYIIHVGLTTINALIVSFVLEALFGILCLHKQAERIRSDGKGV